MEWDKVKIDTPIYVKAREHSPWRPSYFAGYKDGVVYAWHDGKTSQTTSIKTPWRFARLRES